MTFSGRIVAGVLGLGAFTIALIAGLAAENELEIILGRAIASMFGCFAMGLIVGYLCEFAVSRELAAYRAARPIPNSELSVDELMSGLMNAASQTESNPPPEAKEFRAEPAEPLAVRPE